MFGKLKRAKRRIAYLERQLDDVKSATIYAPGNVPALVNDYKIEVCGEHVAEWERGLIGKTFTCVVLRRGLVFDEHYKARPESLEIRLIEEARPCGVQATVWEFQHIDTGKQKYVVRLDGVDAGQYGKALIGKTVRIEGKDDREIAHDASLCTLDLYPIEEAK